MAKREKQKALRGKTVRQAADPALFERSLARLPEPQKSAAEQADYEQRLARLKEALRRIRQK